jgi:hypothetical protein
VPASRGATIKSENSPDASQGLTPPRRGRAIVGRMARAAALSDVPSTPSTAISAPRRTVIVRRR